MLTIGHRPMLIALTLGFLSITGAVMAQNPEPKKPESLALKAAGGTELPEKVAKLVNAMPEVRRVEQIETGLFAVHVRMDVTGSRIRRDVKLEVAEDGEVVDWGHASLPFIRTYTRRQILGTGQMDLAEALERLHPAINSRGGG